MLKHILLTLLLLITISINSYTQYHFTCGFSSDNLPDNPPIGNGMTKPMKTLPTTSYDKYFRVLMIFIEFNSDTSSSSSPYWSPNNEPVYMNSLLAPIKVLGLDAYEDYKLSDYFNKITLDQFDVIGDVYHIVLPYNYDYYVNNGGISAATVDAFESLESDPNFDWDRYDLWRFNSNTQEFEMVQDDYIDMIYIQHRRIDPFNIPYGGVASTLADFTTNNGKYVSSESVSYIGSGVTGFDGADMPIEAVLGLFRHEQFHYAYGYHKPYSTIAGGTDMELCGYELGLAPMDMIAVGLGNVINFNSSTTGYSIGDYHTTGDIVKISTGTSGEYFEITNRQRLLNDGSGRVYDCNMAGDTAMGAPFKQFQDYSKGLYIYHVEGGDGFGYWADLECADGLFNWTVDHSTTPDWSSEQIIPVFKTTGVGYNDDKPATMVGRMSSRDGHSAIGDYHAKWFAPGVRHTYLGENGVDRVFTNDEDDRCSRDCMGDRWDAWKVGYNEVFSPYSSPNTKNRSDDSTGIFVYLESQNGNTANLKIYKVGEGGFSEDSILHLTPPSRPMGLTLSMSDCIDHKTFPVLTWNHNMEPDMIQIQEPLGDVKRYLIYRAEESISNVPTQYSQIADIMIHADSPAVFTDYDAYIQCGIPGLPTLDYRLRYKIKAVDVHNTVSVYSDFVGLPVYLWQRPGGDNFTYNEENNEPVTFSLSQNYPNPFNPSTDIKFSIPFSSFVSLKIYNMLGEEVAGLINNEFKETGNYSVRFDGSNLASGVYFYKLEAGLLTSTKKMILIK
ncbi:MAG: T9SS C-terminal target domain-containing protein [Ignavibacteriae bacterium]|nr:MAG: T9SS C-terminal target domain-containing protein [Ignavibacteriota bacterium]